MEPKQTEVVKALKKIAQAPPALKIPKDGKRILQIDVGNHYWRAVLIEEIDGNIDLVTKLLICRIFVDLWKTIDDYRPNLKVEKK